MSSKVAPFLSAISARRSIYALKPELPSNIGIKDVQETVQTIIKETPTSFNSQTNRALILTGDVHKKVWDSVLNSIEGDSGKKRPTSIRDEAYGTVVFLVNDETTKAFQEQFPIYASYFPPFAEHSTGAAQISSWTALELLGLGAHLQHYNDAVKAALPAGTVPDTWSVHAQLVFGAPVAPATEKTYIENPVKILE
ncbi:LAFE_0G01508g1_1 [Lachancea fermentati]|uniref:LAFE_0G01508g1_1 n=1 Tax=Lachancea fermentati TaxID=4955 RepID=A0A1G4MGJ9_LACFM|nr:LAFE_0G01508g1_1 [Lachancea fermentati]